MVGGFLVSEGKAEREEWFGMEVGVEEVMEEVEMRVEEVVEEVVEIVEVVEVGEGSGPKARGV